MDSLPGLPVSCPAPGGWLAVADYQRGYDALCVEIITLAAEDGPCPYMDRLIGAQQYAFIRLNAFRLHGGQVRTTVIESSVEDVLRWWSKTDVCWVTQGWRLSDLALDDNPGWITQAVEWEDVLEHFAEQADNARGSRSITAVNSDDHDKCSLESPSTEFSTTPPASILIESSPATSDGSRVFVDPENESGAYTQSDRLPRYLALLDAIAVECNEWTAHSLKTNELRVVRAATPVAIPFTPILVPLDLENDLREHHETVFDPDSPGARRRRAVRAGRKPACSTVDFGDHTLDALRTYSASPSVYSSSGYSSSDEASDSTGTDERTPSDHAWSPVPMHAQYRSLHEFKDVFQDRSVWNYQLHRRSATD